jgi:hypothetical protein
MGEVVFWTLIRLAVSIPLMWVLKDYLDYSIWWISVAFVLYGFVLHPAILAYRKFELKNESLISGSLCSSCKHFDKSAVLCIKYDEHPTENYIPCNSLDWEPRTFKNEDQY